MLGSDTGPLQIVGPFLLEYRPQLALLAHVLALHTMQSQARTCGHKGTKGNRPAVSINKQSG
jgi:hypothetical protein